MSGWALGLAVLSIRSGSGPVCASGSVEIIEVLLLGRRHQRLVSAICQMLGQDITAALVFAGGRARVK